VTLNNVEITKKNSVENDDGMFLLYSAKTNPYIFIIVIK